MRIMTGFESTRYAHTDLDCLETSGHSDRLRHDLDLLRETGVEVLRYPVRWHLVERERGIYDWDATDRALDHVRDAGLIPVVDLVHHISHPTWLTDGVLDPRFGPALLAYCEAFFARHPWITAYTIFNEPFSTLFLAAHEGIWPPFATGVEAFTAAVLNVVPWLQRSVLAARAAVPHAQHVWTDSVEQHSGSGLEGVRYAELANDRRFAVIDAFLGRFDDRAHGRRRPFVDVMLRHGAGSLVGRDPAPIDVLGLDYYAHNQWHFGPGRADHSSPRAIPLSGLIASYANRFDLPVAVTETNVRGHATDRASWLRLTASESFDAMDDGVDIRAYCWFPFVDSCDWDSLLARSDRNRDPVGVYWLDDRLERRASAMSRSFAALAGGAHPRSLPDFPFLPPLDVSLGPFRRATRRQLTDAAISPAV